LLQALVDGGSAINLIHESIVSSLKIPVTPCVGPKVSLADGKATLSCNSFVVLSYILAGVSKRDTFFVFSIGAQAVILGMPWLEKVNPFIDWVSKTVEPRPAPSTTTPPFSTPTLRSPSPPPYAPSHLRINLLLPVYSPLNQCYLHSTSVNHAFSAYHQHHLRPPLHPLHPANVSPASSLRSRLILNAIKSSCTRLSTSLIFLLLLILL